MDEPNDEDLLARFVALHDHAAFETLMRRHEDRIFALALRMTGDRADALDAAQETFVAAFRRAPGFRGESSFGTWLYSIGLNTCRDLLRKRKRLPVPEEHLPEGAPTPGVDEQVALGADLTTALALLPEDYRVAVVMHDVGGYPYEEIATRTATNIGTVKSRISRGRRRLARLMEQPAREPSSKEVT